MSLSTFLIPCLSPGFSQMNSKTESPICMFFLCQGETVVRILEPECLSSNPSSAICQLCDLGQVIELVCASPCSGLTVFFMVHPNLEAYSSLCRVCPLLSTPALVTFSALLKPGSLTFCHSKVCWVEMAFKII